MELFYLWNSQIKRKGNISESFSKCNTNKILLKHDKNYGKLNNKIVEPGLRLDLRLCFLFLFFLVCFNHITCFYYCESDKLNVGIINIQYHPKSMYITKTSNEGIFFGRMVFFSFSRVTETWSMAAQPEEKTAEQRHQKLSPPRFFKILCGSLWPLHSVFWII